eukprot:jgi/Mesvir1/13243/Mv18976-RA.1
MCHLLTTDDPHVGLCFLPRPGEIFEGPAARPVRPGENDAEVLLAVLATCVVVNDSAVASNDGMTRDSIITDRSAVTSNSTMASGSTMASDSAVTGDSNNPMADHNAEAVGGAHLNDSCIMPKGPERSREAHPLDGGDPPPLSPYPTVPDVLSRLRGPWALVYWQAAARTLWVARDAIGRRSLLMHAPSTHDPRLIVSSVAVAHPYADDGTWARTRCVRSPASVAVGMSIRFDGAMEVDVPGGTREGRAAATGVAAVVGYDASKVAACDATGCGAVDVDALVRRGLLAAECTGCVDVTCPGPQVAGVGLGGMAA